MAIPVIGGEEHFYIKYLLPNKLLVSADKQYNLIQFLKLANKLCLEKYTQDNRDD